MQKQEIAHLYNAPNCRGKKGNIEQPNHCREKKFAKSNMKRPIHIHRQGWGTTRQAEEHLVQVQWDSWGRGVQNMKASKVKGEGHAKEFEDKGLPDSLIWFSVSWGIQSMSTSPWLEVPISTLATGLLLWRWEREFRNDHSLTVCLTKAKRTHPRGWLL